MKYSKNVLPFLALIFLISCSPKEYPEPVVSISISSRGSSLTSNITNLGPGAYEFSSDDVTIVVNAKDYEDKNQGNLSELCEAQPNNEFEQAVLFLVNEARRKEGFKVLIEQTQLTKVARAHSYRMGCNNFFGHETGPMDTVESRIIDSGYSYSALGEIIAAGYSLPEEVVASWLSSRPHQELILNETFSEIGIGYVNIEESGYGHYWTIVFGHP